MARRLRGEDPFFENLLQSISAFWFGKSGLPQSTDGFIGLVGVQVEAPPPCG